MKILIAGSNLNNNGKEKERAIALFLKAGHKAKTCKEVYRSCEESLVGNYAVLDHIRTADLFYIVASKAGYAGHTTASRLGYAAASGRPIWSSHKLLDESLAYFVSKIVPIDEVADTLSGEISPRESLENYISLNK